MKLASFDDLFLLELRDLHSAERQLIAALPKMVEGATSPELRQTLEEHLQQTEHQLERLEEIGTTLDLKLGQHKCKAMEGLIAEGEELLKIKADDAVRDAAIIGAAQRVEHYEIAGYGTARTYAQALGYEEAVRLLQETLDEEFEADKLLTELALSSVNPRAQDVEA